MVTKAQAKKVAEEIMLRDRPSDIVVDLEDGGKAIISKDKLRKLVPENIFTKMGQADYYLEERPIFFDRSSLWWMWDAIKKKWEIVDEVDILNMVEEATGKDVITPKARTEIINSLKQEGRKRIPKDIKKTWIQFKDKIVDIHTGDEFEASPEYFVTNPIPWELHKDKFVETPIMDKVFKDWVGEDYVKTLYQILAYCLLPSYPLHRLFCIYGVGLNGKSCFLRLLKKFIGKENVAATELDILLSSRFEITRLHKKLVCQMGETNFSELNKTSIIKKLTGQDTIGFEYKNKNPFESENYAKILIATNNLPTTTDKTVGFYRRWCIIDFPNQFSEKKDILDEIPDEEYEILARKSLFILKDLLKKRKFHKEGTIKDKEKKYEEKSNPLEKFWKDKVVEEFNRHIFKYDFRDKLADWCSENRFRRISDMTIAGFMKEKNIETNQVQAEWFTNEGKKPIIRAWIGVKWKE